MATSEQIEAETRRAASPRKVLGAACGIHAVHDGYTDTLYLLLPLWQAEFALSYGAVGILRGLYSAALAGLQVPAAALTARISPVLLLAGGTALSGLAYILAGTSVGLTLLVASLILGGLGSSTNHPIGSELVAAAFPGNAARPALGTYNFAGDVGKVAFPAGAALLLTFVSWRETAMAVGAVGIASALALLFVLPWSSRHAYAARPTTERALPFRWTRGFAILLSTGIVDSATRMAFITFLPFVLAAKDAPLAINGLALALTFAGGAAGKLTCGLLGARFGVTRTIVITKAVTGALIIACLALPPLGILVILPAFGAMLNGTSSVLYGSVPDFAAPEARARAFGIFYTGTIGGGALAPISFGFLSDMIGLFPMMVALACTALLTLPLAVLLSAMGSKVEVSALQESA